MKPELHRGKLARVPRVLSVRPLVREDLGRLKQGEGRVVPRLKSFRETHHRIARMIAAGHRDGHICQLTGFSSTRLSSLKQDPAFQQLITEYRAKVDERWIESLDEFFESANEAKLRAIQMVHDHLDRAEDTQELIPLHRLVPLIGDLADRTGHGKHSSSTAVSLDYAAVMERIASRSGRSNVIDAKASNQRGPVAPPQSSSDPSGPTTAAVGLRRRY